MDELNRADLFLQLSSVLCGVAVDSFKRATATSPVVFPKVGDLSPRNTPIDRTIEFLETLDSNIGASIVDGLLKTFSQIKTKSTPIEAAEYLLNADVTAGICRSVMKMWFLGVWYSPADPFTPHHVISTQA